MAGEINRQYIEAVVRKIAGLQNPDTVVVQYAMNKDYGGFIRIECLASGIGIGFK